MKGSSRATCLIEGLLEGKMCLWSVHYLVDKLATGNSHPLSPERYLEDPVLILIGVSEVGDPKCDTHLLVSLLH
jgi:hypothetical protein